MSTPAYDPNNPFGKILRGEWPSARVFEDAHTLAFMDIMPRVPGHTLVIPKAPSRNILDVAPADLAACIATVQRVSRAVVSAFVADGVTVQQFNESAGGQVVFHLHFHILPRMDGQPMGKHTGKMEDRTVLDANAKKINAALGAL